MLNIGIIDSADGAAPPVPVTWNPADKDSHVVLSNGDLTMSIVASAAFCSVRATQSRFSGKYYYEVVTTGNSLNDVIGLGNEAADLASLPGNDANGIGLRLYDDGGSGSTVLYKGANTAIAPVIASGAGGVFGVGYDADSGAVIFYKSGVAHAVAPPFVMDAPAFPMVAALNSGGGPNLGGVTARFKAADIQFLPAGYLPWES